MKRMKRIIQVLLLIVVIILTYMCIMSIRQGMVNENAGEMPIVEDFENENPNP
jgi:hypothetical protein